MRFCNGKNDFETKNNVFLAPMAGITDLTFRVLCCEQNAGLVYSEMVSAKGINFKNENTNSLLVTDQKERPVGIQLFGRDPDILSQVVYDMTNKDNRDFDLIDLNMGCPAPKIIKNGEGSALMKEPELVRKIVKAVVKASEVPVTVKIRKGFNAMWINAVDIAKIIEDSGAAAVCIHGRTREQFYGGEADWDIIRKAKESVSIPVIGNGDITSAQKAKEMLDYTGCDGIMIGRGAQGNPWVFKQITEYLENGHIIYCPTNEEKIEMALKHTELAIAHKGEYVGLKEMRKHLCWYIKGIQGAPAARVKINKSSTADEIKEILFDLLQQ